MESFKVGDIVFVKDEFVKDKDDRYITEFLFGLEQDIEYIVEEVREEPKIDGQVSAGDGTCLSLYGRENEFFGSFLFIKKVVH